MNNRISTFLVLAVLFGMGFLLFQNYFTDEVAFTPPRFIARDNIQGVEVFKGDKPFQLTFEQQNAFANFINRAVHTGFEKDYNVKKGPFSYTKIVIHQIEGKPIEGTPYGMLGEQLLLQIPEWESKGLIRETGPGGLNQLLNDAVEE